MSLPSSPDRIVQQHAAERARDFGGSPRVDDILVKWHDPGLGPDMMLFRARWTDRSGARALAGAWLDGEVDSRPLEAVDRILRRHRDVHGRLPAADVAALACAILLDAEARHRPLTGPVDGWPAVARTRWGDRLARPAYLGDADLPLSFWWLDEADHPVRIEIARDRGGRIAFTASPLRAGPFPDDRHGGAS